MGASETNDAIAAAEGRCPPGAQNGQERALILQRWYDLINAHANDLAQMITAECGKPLAEAKGEVGYGASFIGGSPKKPSAYGDHSTGGSPTSA